LSVPRLDHIIASVCADSEAAGAALLSESGLLGASRRKGASLAGSVGSASKAQLEVDDIINHDNVDLDSARCPRMPAASCFAPSVSVERQCPRVTVP
jgi:hypothetical protein